MELQAVHVSCTLLIFQNFPYVFEHIGKSRKKKVETFEKLASTSKALID